jgi:hypothetical protein
LDVAVDNDWADPESVDRVMSDIDRAVPGRSFCAKDNGQASIRLYLSEDEAKALRQLGAELSGR